MLCNQSRNISYPINLHGFLAQIDVEEDCSWGKVNGSLSEMINSEFIIYNNIYVYTYIHIYLPYLNVLFFWRRQQKGKRKLILLHVSLETSYLRNKRVFPKFWICFNLRIPHLYKQFFQKEQCTFKFNIT